MAMQATAIYAQSRTDIPRRKSRGESRGFGWAVLAAVTFDLVIFPAVTVTAAMTFRPFGDAVGGILTLLAGVAAAGAVGWVLRSWWWPLLSPIPGIGLGLLVIQWMMTSDDPSAGLLLFLALPLLAEGILIAVGAIIGVALARLIRR